MERLSEDKQRAVRRTHEWADSKFDEQDYESAFMLYEGLVEHDPSGFSYYRLALMYLEGLGVPKDQSKAEYLFSRAWALLSSPDNIANTTTTTNNVEDAWVQFAMGRMCENGYSVEKDWNKAEQYYMRSADLGHAPAQYLLGCHLMKGNIRDRIRAADYLQKAMVQGKLDAQVQLGLLYLMGEGVEMDRQKAFELFSTAAAKSNSMGQYRLGTMYYHGRGVSENKYEALRLYRLSAEQGNARAQNELAWIYRSGKIVKKDMKEAYRLYKLSAEQDHVEAIYSLALMTKHGEGVAADVEKAEELFERAAKLGHVQARSQSLQMSQNRLDNLKMSKEANIPKTLL